MTISIRNVNFGSAKTGLSTVAYRLIGANGTEQQARTTDGVIEVLTGTGIYQASISTPVDWQGTILWDTGESAPRYASDSIAIVASSGAVGGFGIVPVSGSAGESVWTDKDKKKVFKALKQILDKVGGSGTQIAEKIQVVESTIKAIRDHVEKPDAGIHEIRVSLSSIGEILDTLIEATVVMSENQEMKEIIQEATDHVEAQLAQAEG